MKLQLNLFQDMTYGWMARLGHMTQMELMLRWGHVTKRFAS